MLCFPASRVCSLQIVGFVLFLAAIIVGCAPVNAQLSAAEFVDTVGPDDVIIDVRTPAETAEGHLQGALMADVTAPDFESRVAGLERDATIYVYCRSGNRSGRAADQMRAMGFKHVINIGGYADLRAAGAPVEEPAPAE